MGIGIAINRAKINETDFKKEEMSTTHDIPWMKLLQTKTVSNLIAEEENFHLITIDECDDALKILSTLKEHNISSAPVKSSSQYIGIVDIEDLVTTACAVFSPTFLTESTSSSQTSQFLQKNTRQVVEISGRNWWHEVTSSQNILSLVSLLSHPNVHRVAVVHNSTNDRVVNSENVAGIITQSMVLHFIYRHKSSFSSLLQHNVNTAFIAALPAGDRSNQVECISQSDSILHGFRTLWEKEVSGVAVVNDDGVLIGNLSASDLKRINFQNQEIYQPVWRMLEEKQQTSSGQHGMVYAVKEKDSVELVVDLMTQHKVHRIFVVDENQHPIAVVSICDILQYLLKNIK